MKNAVSCTERDVMMNVWLVNITERQHIFYHVKPQTIKTLPKHQIFHQICQHAHAQRRSSSASRSERDNETAIQHGCHR
jgi:hypothetical protein